jgi:hypothetical protein
MLEWGWSQFHRSGHDYFETVSKQQNRVTITLFFGPVLTASTKVLPLFSALLQMFPSFETASRARMSSDIAANP